MNDRPTLMTATSESLESLPFNFFAGGSLTSSSISMHSTSLEAEPPFVAKMSDEMKHDRRHPKVVTLTAQQ